MLMRKAEQCPGVTFGALGIIGLEMTLREDDGLMAINSIRNSCRCNI